MNWIDFVAGIFVGVGIVAPALESANKRFGKWLASRVEDKPIPPPQYDPKDVALNRKPENPPKDPSCPWQWHTMPCGTRLELGDTGFYIVLDTSNAKTPYTGYTPEHFDLARSNNLSWLKNVMKEGAIERTEFAPKRGGE